MAFRDENPTFGVVRFEPTQQPNTQSFLDGSMWYDVTAKQFKGVAGGIASSLSSASSPANVFSLSPAPGCSPTANCFSTPANTRQISDASITNGSTTVTSAGQANWTQADVGKRIWAFTTCATDPATQSGAIIGSAVATTIASVQSATSITLSTAATGTQANTACVIFGSPDDTGFSNIETAMLASGSCPKEVLPLGNMMWTSWHFGINPGTCTRQGWVQGATIFGGGFTIEGQGYGQSVIYLDPLISFTGCTLGAALDVTTVSGGSACMIVPPQGVWKNFHISGGGNTRNGLTTNKNLIQAGYDAVFEDMYFTNFGASDNNLIGLYVSENFAGGGNFGVYGGMPFECRNTIFDGWGSTNVKLDPGQLKMQGCSFQDSNGGNAQFVGGIWLNGTNSSIDSAGKNYFFGGTLNTNFMSYVKSVCNGCVMRFAGSDQFWTNGTVNPTVAIETAVNPGTVYVEKSNFVMTAPSPMQNVGVDLGVAGSKAYIRDSTFNLTANGNWINTVAGTSVFDLGGNIITAGTTIQSGAGVWTGAGSYIPYQGVTGTCTGVATAASTLGLYGTGPNVTATTCTSTTVGTGIPMNHSGTISALQVTTTAAGVNASSGVFTVLKNGVATTVTCTVGTGTNCADGTHTASFVSGDLISIQFTTQTAETLAGIKAIVSAW